jgi:hypothetical protein
LIEPSVLRAAKATLEVQMHLLAAVIPRFILIKKPLPPLHAMAQSRHGAMYIMEVKTHPTHPPTKAIPKFIQLLMPLPPLKLMAQSRGGAEHIPCLD